MSGAPNTRIPPRSPAARAAGTRAPMRLLFIVAAIAGVLLVIGTLPRWWREHHVERAARETAAALPIVTLTQPHRATEPSVTLPGNIQGGRQTTIQARTSGYVEKLYVDLGSRVKAGQRLADISSPELDQQAAQAVAQTAQARSVEGQARAALAHSREQVQVQRAAVAQKRAQLLQAEANFRRNWSLYGQGYVARQDAETAATAVRTARADLKAAEAAVSAAEADVLSAQKGVSSAQQAVTAAQANQQRYAALRSFEQVTAPFDGVITARNVDVGTLINAGGGGSGGSSAGSGNSPGVQQPSATSGAGMFQIANSDTVRIQVHVPETFAPAVRAGSQARVTTAALPARRFDGKVNLSSEAIDLGSRTLQVTIDIPNPEHLLLPGMYAQVELLPEKPPTVIRIPDSALLQGAQGNQVVVLDAANRVHFQKVEPGRDYGTEIEILSGVSEEARLVDNPSDALKEGDEVQIAAAPPERKKER